jgi:hypothetical protein
VTITGTLVPTQLNGKEPQLIEIDSAYRAIGLSLDDQAVAICLLAWAVVIYRSQNVIAFTVKSLPVGLYFRRT